MAPIAPDEPDGLGAKAPGGIDFQLLQLSWALVEFGLIYWTWIEGCWIYCIYGLLVVYVTVSLDDISVEGTFRYASSDTFARPPILI